MKIALVGNMNNNMFPLMKHLRSKGYDAHLFFSNQNLADHFHPKADTFFIEDLQYCHAINWLDNLFYNVNILKKFRISFYEKELLLSIERIMLSTYFVNRTHAADEHIYIYRFRMEYINQYEFRRGEVLLLHRLVKL